MITLSSRLQKRILEGYSHNYSTEVRRKSVRANPFFSKIGRIFASDFRLRIEKTKKITSAIFCTITVLTILITKDHHTNFSFSLHLNLPNMGYLLPNKPAVSQHLRLRSSCRRFLILTAWAFNLSHSSSAFLFLSFASCIAVS